MAKRKVGRPKIEIDWREFEKLCFIQSTLEEMSAWFRCDSNTLELAVKKQYGQNFKDVFQEKRGFGKISLRRKMFQNAIEKDNTTLLIWLSKNHLGMSDKIEEKSEVKVESTVEYKTTFAGLPDSE